MRSRAEILRELVIEQGEQVKKEDPSAEVDAPEVGETEAETVFAIIKAEPDNNMVFGWGSVAVKKDGETVIDHSKDIIEITDLEGAVYKFMEDYRESGLFHIGKSVGTVVESLVVTPEKLEKMGLAPDALPLGWWVGVHIESDEIFAKVKDGTFKMFSIQGKALKEEVNEDEEE